MEKFIEIKFEGKIYKINEEKVNFIIEVLENSKENIKNVKAKQHSSEEIKSLLEKYELNEEHFFENINNA